MEREPNKDKYQIIADQIRQKIKEGIELTDDEEELNNAHWYGFSVRLGPEEAKKHDEQFADFIKQRYEAEEKRNN